MGGSRQRVTTPRELEGAAIRLFTELGFDETTIDQIAEAVGVNRRTFFRYFPTKDAVLWSFSNEDLTRAQAILDSAPRDQPVMAAVQSAVVAANQFIAEDAPRWRARAELLKSSPALRASTLLHAAEWEDLIASFVARRTNQLPTDLIPMAVGRAILGVWRAAFDEWLAHGDAHLTDYIDTAMAALATGFADL